MKTDDELTRAAAWTMMLANAGKHPEVPVSAKARKFTGYNSQEEMERRGGAREPFARSNSHLFNNYRINSRRNAT